MPAKKLRALAKDIQFNEGSSPSVQDAFLRYLVNADPTRPEKQRDVMVPTPVRKRIRRAPKSLKDLDQPQQLSFSFAAQLNKKF